MTVDETVAGPLAGHDVVMTLADGSAVSAYIVTVGFAGLRAVVDGEVHEYRYSFIDSITEA